MPRPATNLRNRVFGSLLVLRRAKARKGSNCALWVCECLICGKHIVVKARDLKANRVKSCGCLKVGARKGGLKEKQKCRLSASTARLEFDNFDPFQNLANAIVCTAADDYRAAIRSGDIELLEELDDFFSSEWYKQLTKVPASEIIDDICAEETIRLGKLIREKELHERLYPKYILPRHKKVLKKKNKTA